MGVDVSAVGGFTVNISKDKLQELINNQGCGNAEELFEQCDLEYCWIGSSYSGDVEIILILEPSPKDVDKQIAKWLSEINKKLKTEFSLDDVTFITETYWY